MTGVRAVLASVLFGLSAAAGAACGPFHDVEDGSLFCSSIEWISSREITIGCGANAYCPKAYTTREQVAAMLRRYGAAMTPRILRTEAYAWPQSPWNGTVTVCATRPNESRAFWRIVKVMASLSLEPLEQLSAQWFLEASWDNGATWDVINFYEPLFAVNVNGKPLVSTYATTLLLPSDTQVWFRTRVVTPVPVHGFCRIIDETSPGW